MAFDSNYIVRVATFNASLNRSAEGELAEGLAGGEDSQAQSVAEIIQKTDADVILINEFDYDAEGAAADIFRSDYLEVSQNGAGAVEYPYVYVAPSNTGIPSGFDLDNSGAAGDFAPNDAQGFGFFEGQFGFVIFSKLPIDEDNIRSFQTFLWKDMPGALLPTDPEDADGNGDTENWYTEEELAVLRLSSKNHVDVPVLVDGVPVHILAAHPTPPVFDGAEDRNGTRNHDEIRFWSDYVAGADYIYDDAAKTGGLAPDARFVIVGDYNADPFDGDSTNDAILQLIDAPEINASATDADVTPSSAGGAEQAETQAGANTEHSGDAAFDTADFGFDPSGIDGAPGNLRVDYVLPSANGLTYLDGGVFWPESTDPDFALASFPTSDHRLVYADLAIVTMPTPVSAGDVTTDSAVLLVRSLVPGNVDWTVTSGDQVVAEGTVEITDTAIPAKVFLDDLTPGEDYVVSFVDQAGTTRELSFGTAEAPGGYHGLTFGTTGDWRGDLAPYWGVSNIDERDLDFLVLEGDTIYADFVSPGSGIATDLDGFRAKYDEAYGQRFGENFWADALATTPIYATIDDHEVVNDFAGGADASSDPRFTETEGLINDTAMYEDGLQAFHEFHAIAEEFYGETGDETSAFERKLYRNQQFGDDAAIFVLDQRSFRDAQIDGVADLTDTAEIGRFLTESFDPNRTLLGRAQVDALKADLLVAEEAGVTWKFVYTPEPIQNLGIFNADSWDGYRAERTEILSFVEAEDIDNVVFVAADIHATFVNNLTYAESAFGPQLESRAWEITTGSVGFAPAFGEAVVRVAGASGLLSPEELAFYESLPIAPDADDLLNDKDDFVKAAFQSLTLEPQGLDPIGLEDRATLIEGDYIVAHSYSWTEFDIDAETQALTVTTFGVDAYEPDDVSDAAEPRILSQFTVDAESEDMSDTFTLELFHLTDQEASSGAILDAPNLSGVLNALQAQDVGEDASLVLSSGDAFIPGVFFDASEAAFGSAGIADIQIQNELGVQAIALGNHEFDTGTEDLAALIDGSATGDFSALVGSNLEGLDFTGTDMPYLSANLDISTDDNLASLEIDGGAAPQGNVITTSTVISAATNGASMADGENGFTVTPIHTVGEEIDGYTPPGIMDGIGAYALNDDTVRVLVNHELVSWDGYAYTLANGTEMTGARISYFDIDKESREIVDAGLAFDTVYAQDGAEITDPVAQLLEDRPGLMRFCSANLMEAAQFGEGNGLADRIYFAPEETGGNFSGTAGNIWALDVDNGDLWAVPAMGLGGWENLSEVDTGTDTHTAFVLMDDTSPFDADGDEENEAAPMFLYVGEKDAEGDFLARNGLKDGKLYVWVSDAGYLDPSDFNGGLNNTPQIGDWVLLDNAQNVEQASEDGTSGYDQYGYPTQRNLWTQAEALGAFGFSRPEDVATNPEDGTEVGWASTGRSSDFDGADQIGTIYSTKIDFTDIDAPKATVSILYDGDQDPTQALRSPDNLDWADDGKIYAQEDRAVGGIFGPGAANPNDASIVALDPETGAVTRVAEINQDVTRGSIDENVAATGQADIGDWESSGILDVSTLFDEEPGSLFLFDVQAHALDDQNRFDASQTPDITDDNLKEGGQLSFLSKGADLGDAAEKIGVVGATTPTLASISSPGSVSIAPGDFAPTPTEADLDALAAEIQSEVDALLAANPDMNKVVLLSHMQQIDIELALAERLEDVDIIVAGGSNTRLLDEDDRLQDGDTAQGTYPIIVDNAGGTKTAVVNTDGSYKYLGRLVIDFDADGNILEDSYDPSVSGAYATDAQGVADLDAADLIDPEIQAIVDAIEAEIVASEGNVFGLSDVFLNGNRAGGPTDGVRTQETNLGNLTADANLAAAQDADAEVVISLKNGGGIRANIGETVVPAGGSSFVRQPNAELRDADGNIVKPAGGISENDIKTTLAFNNDLVILTLTRAEIVDLLEHGVDALPGVSGRFPQVSGVNFSFDQDRPSGNKIVNAGIFAEDGSLIAELVRDGALAGDATESFKVVTLGFLAAPRFDDDGVFTGGGDGYPFPNTNTDPELGEVGEDAARINPVFLEEEGVQTGAATFADNGTEQDALAEYLVENYTEVAFSMEDISPEGDLRIQNLDFRADTIFGEVAGFDFLDTVFDSYGDRFGPQDQGIAEVSEDGSAVTLSQNAWKSIALPTALSVDTVMGFDFSATGEGEIFGIGFDSDTTESEDVLFRLFGSQDWGIGDFSALQSGEATTYQIRLGDYFTAQEIAAFDRLTLVADDDAGLGGEATFSNLSFETPMPSTEGAINFFETDVLSFSTAQDKGAATRSDDGTALTVIENGWKYIDISDEVLTANTVLSFDFTAIGEGEIHAIGLNDGGKEAEDQFFRLFGTQDWGIDDLAGLYAGPGTTYTIRLGDYFSDASLMEIERLVLVTDQDSGTGAGSTFGNIMLETVEPETGSTVNFALTDVSSFSADQDMGSAARSEDGTALTLTGNAWKAIDITGEALSLDTVLNFTFTATALGEIQGIGFDADGKEADDEIFRLLGTQDYGIDAYAAGIAADGVEHEVSIRLGDHFSADEIDAFDTLAFINDDDVDGSGVATFSDLAFM